MSFSARTWTAGIIATALCLPGAAQIESSGLGDVSAWGVSYLDRSEEDFGRGLWTGSDIGYLLDLMEGIDVTSLSLPEKQLLSRALRAPSSAPDTAGSEDKAFQAARVEALLALGERRAAASLADQANVSLDGVNPDIILSDERLVEGEREVVCAQMNTSGEGRFWSELRAICALEASRDGVAELAIEIAGQQEGASPWFGNVGFAVLGEQEEKPAARYGSGIELALSDLAELEPDEDSISEARPDIAARIARNDERPLNLRLAAAGIAARADMLSPDTHRELYRAQVSEAGFEPSNDIEAAFAVLAKEPEPEMLEYDLPSRANGPVDLRSSREDWIGPVRPGDLDENVSEAGRDDEISLAEEQSLAVSQALRTVESHDEFAARARLFEAALEEIPADDDTAGSAFIFAAAAMETGNISLTDKWLDVTDPEALEEADRFRFALLEGYASVFGGERRDVEPDEFAGTLIEMGVEPAQEAAALTLFSVWAGLDMPVPASARAALARSDRGARRIDAGMLAAIEAAERNGATGEALLGILSQTNGAPGELSGADLSTLLWSLQRMDALRDAKALALEAAGLWRLAAQPAG
ncbi:hypothetical protein [Henriciella sp.]|uniref:hypothetical protein n=1 Tax=Henriciella sp. TaxID=1968823 RepID=UPI002636A55A|nr:hypothetical protein [Henriciella sp.]